MAVIGGVECGRSVAIAEGNDGRGRNDLRCTSVCLQHHMIGATFMRKKQGVLGDLTETANKVSAKAGELISDVASSKAVKRAAGSALAAASSLLSTAKSAAAPKRARRARKTKGKRKTPRRAGSAAKGPSRQKTRKPQ
jgi:hypothetical protein